MVGCLLGLQGLLLFACEGWAHGWVCDGPLIVSQLEPCWRVVGEAGLGSGFGHAVVWVPFIQVVACLVGRWVKWVG